jgi:hypothetical protein
MKFRCGFLCASAYLCVLCVKQLLHHLICTAIACWPPYWLTPEFARKLSTVEYPAAAHRD